MLRAVVVGTKLGNFATKASLFVVVAGHGRTNVAGVFRQS
jgi:hypothetical protein